MMIEKLAPKPFKTFQEQLDIYKARGLIIEDDRYALRYLQTIGYYRLSGYSYPFRQILDNKTRADEFMPNTHFRHIKDLYVFDRQLRQLAIDALERIEVAMRVQITYRLSQYGVTSHLQSQFFNYDFNRNKRNKWLSKYYQLIERSQKSSDFVKHHEEKYSDMPIWAHCELWDFGTMSMLYAGMLQEDKDKIAIYFGLSSHKVLETQLHALNIIRNISAHYGRLWNRHLGKPASFRNMGEPWVNLSENANNVLVYFCLMQYFLKQISPNSQWGQRFLILLDDFPKVENDIVNLTQMGLNIPFDKFKSWDLWQK